MVYIHTAFFICSSVSAKSRPGFHCGNRGGLFALFVLFQALTQSLAGVLDGSLGGGAKITERLVQSTFACPVCLRDSP